ncbi:SDR family oxidoreductase [Persicobacter diffluens]|uniref:Dioxygenase n=1 Tax=Persicobacter diffluens TaxID=981 RepID=A0AAN5AN21_9BACT|nr:dioxygenase [Persicobacter diffluens]
MTQQDYLFDLEGKVAIITGGAGVLGSTIASYLLSQKVSVFLLDLNEELLQNAVAAMKEKGDIHGLVCNVLQKESLQNCKATILETHHKIDLLINAAGGNMKGANIAPEQSIFDMNMDDFKKVNDLNFHGTVLPSMVFGEQIAKSGKGSIINFSSMATIQSITRVVGYSSAKASVDNFTQWMSMEMAIKFGDGIRVNAIAPGFFVTHQNRAVLLNEDGSLTERSKLVMQKTPMRRFGKPEELNGVIHFLSSDASSFVTGTIIPIDGGFSAFSGV